VKFSSAHLAEQTVMATVRRLLAHHILGIVQA
jgi:hypothetical protein